MRETLVDVVDADILHDFQAAPHAHVLNMRKEQRVDALHHGAGTEPKVARDLRAERAAKLIKR